MNEETIKKKGFEVVKAASVRQSKRNTWQGVALLRKKGVLYSATFKTITRGAKTLQVFSIPLKLDSKQWTMLV